MGRVRHMNIFLIMQDNRALSFYVWPGVCKVKKEQWLSIGNVYSFVLQSIVFARFWDKNGASLSHVHVWKGFDLET